ncbi:RHS repeat-associated core domain-containing protein [Rhodanobacter caeni]|uniref:Teneurin-like YD-shell domain-containing protein n=1 Tax=Rhodanobacter caeni TaxID=657654 RepID=A0ABN0UXJ7_9GAMM
MNHRTRSLTILVSWLLLAITTHARTVTYVYTDPQGTPLIETDTSGNITAQFEYTPYGRPVVSIGAAPNGPGYTGHVNDPDTGFVYMQARYYDPVMGRFLGVDPARPSPGNPYNFNRYAYANNNPLRFTDPTGEATAYLSSNGNVIIVQKFINTSKTFSDAEISNEGKRFDGTTSTGKSTTVLFVPGDSTDEDVVTISSDANLDDTSTDGNKRSHTDMIGGRKITLAINAAGISTAGHELAHVLRAGDQYKDGIDAGGKTLEKDVPGPPSLMKTSGDNNPNQQTIDEIYNGIKSPENTIIPCTSPVSDGGSFCP